MTHPQLKNDWYNYHKELFQDPEFTEKVEQLKQYLEDKYPNIISVGIDSDETLRYMGVKESDIKKIHDFTSEYLTIPFMLSNYLSGFYDSGSINPLLITGRVENGNLLIEFDRDITKADYDRFWPFVKHMKAEAGINLKKRFRGPENWSLLYAIHKAQRHHKKFSEIFKMYEGGELYEYSGSKTQFISEESLKSYFYRYRFRL